MNFVAIDVETANSDMASICQIGIAVFKQGVLTDEWVTLVNPEDYFDDMNIQIHGITPSDVQGQPTLLQIFEALRARLENSIAVCHTHFDRRAVARSLEKYNLPPINCTWLDSARVVRRTWPQFAQRGYGLGPVCAMLGYEFKHHDALEDAKAAGMILVSALKQSEQDIDFWLDRVGQPIDPARSSYGQPIQRDGNPEGQFFGEVLVFTGELDVPRNQAADLAANAGFKVDQGVTKKTTILVVGTQDAWKLEGGEKSTKHLKAEALSDKGRLIRIVQERDFFALVS